MVMHVTSSALRRSAREATKAEGQLYMVASYRQSTKRDTICQWWLRGKMSSHVQETAGFVSDMPSTKKEELAKIW